jgi:hypothetical protein
VIGVRVVAFGTVEPALWGVAWIPDGHVAAPIAVGAPNATAVLEGALAGERPDTDWTLDGEDISIVLSPVGTPRHTADRGGHVESEGALCGVKGQFSLEGEGHEVSCPGWRAAIRSDLEIDQIDSLRAVAGWIERDDGVALMSLRPRRSRGQEADTVLAGVLGPVEAPAVVDPRLSTTYSASGAPARTGLELWFEEASSEEAEDAEPRYPRRAAGEAVGTEIEWDVAGLTLRAHLLRWHTQDQDGAGVYLLGRRQ